MEQIFALCLIVYKGWVAGHLIAWCIESYLKI